MSELTSTAGLRPLTADQEATLQAWRAQALDLEGGMPYMATMLFSLRPLNAPGLGTFAVDPQHRLYIDFEACEPRGVRWCSEALLHECCHLFGEHAARAEDALVTDEERQMSNIAADAEINDDLRDAGCDMSDAVLPETIGAADFRTFEEYLDHLRKRSQQAQRSSQRQGQGQGQGQGNPGGQGQGQPSQANPKPFSGCGSGSGGAKAPCEVGDSDGNNAEFPGATSNERDHTLIATAASIRNEVSSGRGTVPAGLRERAELMLTPSKIPWRRQLGSCIRRAVGSRAGDFDNTWTRLARRRDKSTPFLRPGTFTPTPSIAVVRDTSGSMNADDINSATSEIVAIAKQLGIRGTDLRVLDCDAIVHTVKNFTGATMLADVAGRGGTNMVEGIERAVALRPRPTAIVVISDGGTPWPLEPVGMPVVACLVGHYAQGSSGSVPDWIKTVVVDD